MSVVKEEKKIQLELLLCPLGGFHPGVRALAWELTALVSVILSMCGAFMRPVGFPSKHWGLSLFSFLNFKVN